LSFRHSLVLIVVGLLPATLVPAVSTAQSGGAGAPGPPIVKAVSCMATRDSSCDAGSTLYRGRDFAVRGRNLQSVSRIVFHGAPRRTDDAVVRVVRARRGFIVARVPARARSGRLTLIGRYGARVTTRRPIRVARLPQPAALDIAPSSRFFYAGRRPPSFSFDAHRSIEAQVRLVRDDGTIVRSWAIPVVAGQHLELTWDGRGAEGVERTGRYRFELAGGTSGAVARAPDGVESFFFADHLFPIRGRHNLGYTDTNNFGGGRGHKGQDLFALCGTRLAAARGGTVQYAGYHSAAGYYAVIDGAGTDVDYVYMHMRRPASVSTGDRVFTGQKIGEVGETGRATGCHLHFEMWSTPGWYEGGRAFDPLPALRQWDRYS
jgi:murein DD-endopeptidase MepM/ murein hydrolase activator NlpD